MPLSGRKRLTTAGGLALLAMIASGEDHAPNPPPEQCPVTCYVKGYACLPGGGTQAAPCRGLTVCYGVPRHARANESGHDTLGGLVEPSICGTNAPTSYPDNAWAFAACDAPPSGFGFVGDCTVEQPGTGIKKCCYLDLGLPPPPLTEGTYFETPWIGPCVGPSPRMVDCGPDER